MSVKQNAWLTWISQADIWLAIVSAIVLAGMMVFVFAGAVLRYVFNAPIAGGNEVLEMASVTAVMLAIPHCAARDLHIRIDLLDGVLGRVGRALTDILYRVIGVIVLWFLTNSYVARCLEAVEFEDTTNMLDIPIWPFYGLVAFGMGAYGVILAGQLAAMLIRTRPAS
jgi:TRAP-type C4-dicarboxylate transport system permease small subunit